MLDQVLSSQQTMATMKTRSMGTPFQNMSKVLIFSSWPETLCELSVFLKIRGIKFCVGSSLPGIKISGKSEDQIEKFRNDPNIRVILLNVYFFHFSRCFNQIRQ